MIAPDDPVFVVRRIVVAVDPSAHGRTALRVATSLGARLHAEVEGLFVEDIDLVNLADLAIGREVDLISGHVRTLDRAVIDRDLQTEGASLRRAFEAAARETSLRRSFRVVRGRVTTEVVAAAAGADLLILGVASRSIGRRRRPGSTAIAAAEGAPGSVLLIRPGATLAGRVLVPYDGSAGAEAALGAAISLSESTKDILTVLLVGERDAVVEELRAKVTARLASSETHPRFLRVRKLVVGDICRLCRETSTTTVVVNKEDPALGGQGLRQLIEEVGCPVLLLVKPTPKG